MTAEGEPLTSDDSRSDTRMSAGGYRKREEAARFARASVELEGFRLDEATELLTKRFVDGDVGINDCVAAELFRLRDRRR